jgi:hypoxanthine phosphoribosyltransferase
MEFFEKDDWSLWLLFVKGVRMKVKARNGGKIPLGRILVSKGRIQKRVKTLAKEIQKSYKRKSFKIIGLLNGSLFFLVDLLRELPSDVEVECWRVASYHGHKSSGRIDGLRHLKGDFRGQYVLIVDDIFDSGLTLHEVKNHVQKLGAKGVKTCVLLKKRKKHVRQVKVDWAGFEIGPEYVIGYGLDFNGKFRSLPEIRALSDEDVKRLSKEY